MKASTVMPTCSITLQTKPVEKMRSPSSAKNVEISGSCVTHNHTPRDPNTIFPVLSLVVVSANQPAKEIAPEMGLAQFSRETENPDVNENSLRNIATNSGVNSVLSNSHRETTSNL